MPKPKGQTAYLCENCGYQAAKWMGFCPSCGERTPLSETFIPIQDKRQSWTPSSSTAPQELASVKTSTTPRIALAPSELNRVLGGGLVPGSLVLIAGEPGIGKSTLLLQLAEHLASSKVLYVSGEESVEQVKLRSHRLGLAGKGLHILPETDVDQVLNWLNQLTPAILIVDSIQTLYTQDMPSSPGTVAQVRECTRRLMSWAKTKNAPVLVAGHVTKDGTLAGPRVLEHMVDVVLYLEGERTGSYRLLRSVKNRFGSTNELGVFQMGNNGLEEVTDPSQALLSERPAGAVGSAIVSILEGSRPLLVEVQALNSPSVLPTPRRVANGVDFNRLLMLVAVLTRRAHLNLSKQDIIVNVVGGVQIEEPAADLAIALAIASSYHNIPLPTGVVAMGEIGLSGEVRSVTQPERRLAEAERLGFTSCAVPAPVVNKTKAAGKLKLLGFSSISQAIASLLPRRSASTT